MVEEIFQTKSIQTKLEILDPSEFFLILGFKFLGRGPPEVRRRAPACLYSWGKDISSILEMSLPQLYKQAGARRRTSGGPRPRNLNPSIKKNSLGSRISNFVWMDLV